MSDKPIILIGAEVRATLEGRKKQKRIVIKEPEDWDLLAYLGFERDVDGQHSFRFDHPTGCYDGSIKSPYEIGDKLWVRETWATTEQAGDHKADSYVVYRATDPDWETMEGWKWRPSIHMPRWASQITLEVKDVRVERLKDISEDDALAEGIERREFTRRDGSKMVGYSDDWSRLGQLSRFAGGIFPRNEKHPLKEEDICLGSARMGFANLWNSINEKRGFGWYTNPWVWVIEFEKI